MFHSQFRTRLNIITIAIIIALIAIVRVIVVIMTAIVAIRPIIDLIANIAALMAIIKVTERLAVAARSFFGCRILRGSCDCQNLPTILKNKNQKI